MEEMKVVTHPNVFDVFANYPDNVKSKIDHLRSLIIEAAKELGNIKSLEETLRWREPSYLTKHGSTIRIDWKEKNPEYYAIYFKCTSKLVPTFKDRYNDIFKFEGNRAILFHLNDDIPEKALKNCIKAGLEYHKVKSLPNLGIG